MIRDTIHNTIRDLDKDSVWLLIFSFEKAYFYFQYMFYITF